MTTRNCYATVPIETLKPSGYNRNYLTAEQRAQLAGEIEHQGKLLKPIVCRKDDEALVIVDGEHNWDAAHAAGLTEVPVEVVEVDDFEARRQTFVRNLSGTWHKVRLGRMFRDMLGSDLSNRDLAESLGCSEGTVRNVLLYAKAADLCASRDDCPDEDSIAQMGVREVRGLIAWLEGLTEEMARPAAETEARILARLKRAWKKATEDERRGFNAWTGVTAEMEQRVKDSYTRGFDDGHAFAITVHSDDDEAPPQPGAPAVRNGYAERGTRIREARKAKDMTAKELASLANIAPQIVSMVERGRLTNTGSPAAGRPAYGKLEAALGITND